MVSGKTRFGFVVAALGTALAAASLAGAAGSQNYQYRKTAADQALAARLVLLRPDLAELNGWNGGFVKPDESPKAKADPCNLGNPPANALPEVITGDKETEYTGGLGAKLATGVGVFRSTAMVDRDWEHPPDDTAFLVRCLRAHPHMPAGTKLVSVAPLSISHKESHWTGVRLVIEGISSRQRAAIDLLFFARGRVEVMVASRGLIFSPTDLKVQRMRDQEVHDILARKLAAAT